MVLFLMFGEEVGHPGSRGCKNGEAASDPDLASKEETVLELLPRHFSEVHVIQSIVRSNGEGQGLDHVMRADH